MRHTRYLLVGTALIALAAPALAAQIFQRELDVPDLRLGQHVMIDDGTCPTGQIKQVVGTKLTPQGIVRSRTCIPRLGTKKK
jgi:hypothetical protein